MKYITEYDEWINEGWTSLVVKSAKFGLILSILGYASLYILFKTKLGDFDPNQSLSKEQLQDSLDIVFAEAVKQDPLSSAKLLIQKRTLVKKINTGEVTKIIELMDYFENN